MSAVLGLSGNYHDAAAALVVDGQIVAAIQQERLSRIKNDPSLPFDAARACLDFAGLTPGDLDRIVFYEDPLAKLERSLLDLMRNFPRSWKRFPATIESQLGRKIWARDQISEGLGLSRDLVSNTQHHKSHAASAFFPSPFPEAAVLVVDGVGESQTTTIWRGDASGLRLLDALEFPHSLGLLYAALTAFLGFKVNEGEYKVMGLAARGSARYLDEFSKIIQIQSDGSFTLDMKYFGGLNDLELGFGPRLEKLLGPRRPYGKAWNLEDAEDQRFADVAATLQKVTEDVMSGLAARALSRAGCHKLCLAGGAALNVLANARIASEIGSGNVFVQPAAGDAGGALGAALQGAFEAGDGRPSGFESCALGLAVDVDLAARLAEDLGFSVRRLSDPAAAAGKLLAQDKLLGLVQGRFEWGPRALGQRSLLANPGRKETGDHINRIVKHRENFRPFAPVVLDDSFSDWFAGGVDHMTPFMTTVRGVLPGGVDKLGAVTHHDGSARMQSVGESHCLGPFLNSFQGETGVPVLLNTSLNGPGEPIVASAQDALAFFSQFPIDCLLIEDLLIERSV